MSDVIFLILLLPIFWLPVFACFGLISGKSLFVLSASFMLSCIVYAITQNGFVSCLILAVSAVLISFLVYLIMMLKKIRNIGKHIETTAVVFARKDLNTFAAFDGKNVLVLKADGFRSIRLGDVVKLSLNDF